MPCSTSSRAALSPCPTFFASTPKKAPLFSAQKSQKSPAGDSGQGLKLAARGTVGSIQGGVLRVGIVPGRLMAARKFRRAESTCGMAVTRATGRWTVPVTLTPTQPCVNWSTKLLSPGTDDQALAARE